jgi:hypothetical protein
VVTSEAIQQARPFVDRLLLFEVRAPVSQLTDGGVSHLELQEAALLLGTRLRHVPAFALWCAQ